MFLKCKGYEVTQVIYSSHIAAFGQYFCIAQCNFRNTSFKSGEFLN